MLKIKVSFEIDNFRMSAPKIEMQDEFQQDKELMVKLQTLLEQLEITRQVFLKFQKPPLNGNISNHSPS